jgi:hypothetical protein
MHIWNSELKSKSKLIYLKNFVKNVTNSTKTEKFTIPLINSTKSPKFIVPLVIQVLNLIVFLLKNDFKNKIETPPCQTFVFWWFWGCLYLPLIKSWFLTINGKKKKSFYVSQNRSW